MKKLSILYVVFAILGISQPAVATPINIATSGTATQSSTGTWGGYAQAELAIDGDVNGDYWDGSVSHTLSNLNAWWQVDLGSMQELNSIVLWNRTDCCDYRLTNFNVSVLNGSNQLIWNQDFYTSGGTFNPSLSIALSANTVGQIVKVQLNGTNYLQLAEVQVFSEASGSIPEPSTLILLCLGFAGINLSRKNK